MDLSAGNGQRCDGGSSVVALTTAGLAGVSKRREPDGLVPFADDQIDRNRVPFRVNGRSTRRDECPWAVFVRCVHSTLVPTAVLELLPITHRSSPWPGPYTGWSLRSAMSAQGRRPHRHQKCPSFQ